MQLWSTVKVEYIILYYFISLLISFKFIKGDKKISVIAFMIFAESDFLHFKFQHEYE